MLYSEVTCKTRESQISWSRKKKLIYQTWILILEPIARFFFFFGLTGFLLFTKCKSGPILQFIYSHGPWICRRTFQPEFFHFPCKNFHPGLKEDRRFQAFICIRTEVSLSWGTGFFNFCTRSSSLAPLPSYFMPGFSSLSAVISSVLALRVFLGREPSVLF